MKLILAALGVRAYRNSLRKLCVIAAKAATARARSAKERRLLHRQMINRYRLQRVQRDSGLAERRSTACAYYQPRMAGMRMLQTPPGMLKGKLAISTDGACHWFRVHALKSHLWGPGTPQSIENALNKVLHQVRRLCFARRLTYLERCHAGVWMGLGMAKKLTFNSLIRTFRYGWMQRYILIHHCHRHSTNHAPVLAHGAS